MTHDNDECNKRFCENCKQNKGIGDMCYTRPLKDDLPPQAIRYSTSFMISKLPKIVGYGRG